MAVTVRLSGGLGNQIFQFGVANLISNKTGSSIYLDISDLSKYATPRALALHSLWDLPEVCVSETPIKSSFVNRVRVARFLSAQNKVFGLVNDRNVNNIISDVSVSKTYFLDGYFIESIAQWHFDSWVKMLAGRLKVVREDPVRRVVIHIRGGDFLALGWEMSDAKQFYCHAIDEVFAENPNLVFGVVTDDKAYAHEVLRNSGVNWSFIGGSEIDDFMILVTSEIAIIGNSTFSFCARAFSEVQNCSSLTYGMAHWRPGVLRSLRLRNERSVEGHLAI